MSDVTVGTIRIIGGRYVQGFYLPSIAGGILWSQIVYYSYNQSRVIGNGRTLHNWEGEWQRRIW